MSKELEVIVVGVTGNMDAMHSDTGVINSLGRKSIVRATELLHDVKTDTWYIDPILRRSTPHKQRTALELPDSLCGFSSYTESRLFEVAWVKLCYLEQEDFTEDTRCADILRPVYEGLRANVIANDLTTNNYEIPMQYRGLKSYAVARLLTVELLAELRAAKKSGKLLK